MNDRNLKIYLGTGIAGTICAYAGLGGAILTGDIDGWRVIALVAGLLVICLANIFCVVLCIGEIWKDHRRGREARGGR